MNPAFRGKLENILTCFSGRAGLAAEHLHSRERILWNERMVCPTASMIKVCVLGELFRRRDAGDLRLEDRAALTEAEQTPGSGILRDLSPGLSCTLRDLAVLMMALSDNTATNMLIDRLGIRAINAFARQAGMEQTELRHRIDFTLLARDNDSLAVSTPADFLTLLCGIARHEALTPASCQEMIGIMRIQKYIDGLRRYLPYSPYAAELGKTQDLWVASKTGGLPGVRTEAGIICSSRNAWAVCVMTRDCTDLAFHAEHEGVVTIARISRALFDYFEACP